MNSSSSSSSSSSTFGQTNQLHCAFCSDAGIPCPPDCLFRPYFPNDAQHMTVCKNVLNLFGRENVLNLLKELQPHQRDAEIKNIISEANQNERYEAISCERVGRRSDVADTTRTGILKLLLIRRRLGLKEPSYGRCAACTIEARLCLPECPFLKSFPNDDDENRAAYLKFQKAFYNKLMRLRPEERDQNMNEILDYYAREQANQESPGEEDEPSMTARAQYEAWKKLDII